MRLLAAFVALFVATGVAFAQVTGSVDILPGLSSAGLTDLNNVILFRSASRGAQAFDGAVDASKYRVGPGDIIEINVWTPTARSFMLTVTPEGTLLIPAYGEARIGGMTLDSARTYLVEELGDIFPVSEITATLTQSRRVRVYVSGYVGVPGTYELNASQRVADALTQAQGILPDSGSARHVLRVHGAERETLDLLSFFLNGSGDDNPYLIGGEHIIVPPREPSAEYIEIGGAVMQPGIVEYADGDRISDAIRFAFGFQPRADLGKIVVTRTDPATGRAQTFGVAATVDSADFQITDDMLLQRRDRILVHFLPTSGRTATVAIYGEVARPGSYAVVEDSTTLSELLHAVGGLTPRASPGETVFLRPSYRSLGSAANLPPLVSINLDSLMAGDSTFDIRLKDRDSIYVPSRSLAVQVLGRVRRPGILSWLPNQTVQGYIDLAGGFSADANKKGTRVIRAVTGAVEKPDDDYPPRPGDQILVPEKTPTSIGRKLRDGLSFISTLATTYFVIKEISK